MNPAQRSRLLHESRVRAADVKTAPKSAFASELKAQQTLPDAGTPQRMVDNFVQQNQLGSRTTGTGFGALNPVSITKEIGKNLAKDAYNFSQGMHEVVFRDRQQEVLRINRNAEMMDRLQDVIVKNYREGRISKEEYSEQMKRMSEQWQELSQLNQAVVARTPSGADAAASVVSIGTLPLMAGRLTLSAASFGGLRATANLTGARWATGAIKAVDKLDDLALKIPSIKAGIAQRGLQDAAKYTTRSAFNEAVKAFYIKHPLYVNSTVGDIREIWKELGAGEGIFTENGERDYGNAATTIGQIAFLALEAVEGGPFGAVRKAASKLTHVKPLVFGQKTFWGVIEQANKWEGGFADELQRIRLEEGEEAFQEAKKFMEVYQQINMNKFAQNPYTAASTVMQHYSNYYGIDFATKSPKWFIQEVRRFSARYESFVHAVKAGKVKGLEPEDWSKVALGIFSPDTKKQLIKTLKQVSESADKGEEAPALLAAVQEMVDRGISWTQHENLLNTVIESINKGDWEKRINKYVTAAKALDGLPKKLAKELADDGYVPIRPQRNLGKFVEAADSAPLRLSKEVDGVASEYKGLPGLRHIGSFLENIGVSPEDTGRMAGDFLYKQVASNLDSKDIKAIFKAGNRKVPGHLIISKLQRHAEELTPRFSRYSAVQDIRQLSPKEVASALSTSAHKLSEDDAKSIMRAIMQGYLDTPVRIRGLGDHLQDINYRYNPLAAPYSRLQSGLRYAWNPFFRWQEITETEILAQGLAGGKDFSYLGTNMLRRLFGDMKPLNDTVRKLEKAGIFKADTIGGFSGSAASDQVIGKISANLSKTQKLSLAGLANKIAKRKGQAIDDLIKNKDEELLDALRIVTQYPDKGVLNSSLARTLNIAFFPTRYNLKVTMLAARILSQQPAPVQVAVLNGMLDMKEWMESPEGLAWQRENAEALQVVKWLTPIGSLAWAQRLLTDNVESVSELGLLGGLPFGLISQMLDSQGIVQLDTPYVNPKTGEVFPDYIPETAKARAAVAVTDLISTTFTYPGRTLGLPGKGAMVRGTVDNFIDTNPDEYDQTIREEDLTDAQRASIQAAQDTVPGTNITQLPAQPATTLKRGQTLSTRRPKLEEVRYKKAKKGRGRTKRTASGPPPR